MHKETFAWSFWISQCSNGTNFPICSDFISVNIEVTFSFSGSGGMSLAADKQHCKEIFKGLCVSDVGSSVSGWA